MCGKNAAVDKKTCLQWQLDVSSKLLEGYTAKNIFIADETGLPNKR